MSEAQINPLLDRIQMPGETFTLPSGGLFYHNQELSSDVINGEVHVHPMTAIDEITIKTPDMLYSGKAIEQIFKRCVPQILKPMELLTKDVDYILTCLRKVTYGDILEVLFTHTCKDAKEHSYNISIDQFIKKTKRIDPTTISTLYFIKLDNGQQIKIKPVNFGSFVKIMQDDKEDKTPEQVKDDMFITLSDIIVSVDEIEDKEMINQWLNSVPAKWLHAINSQIDKSADWGPEFVSTEVCKDCEEEISVTVPLNPVAFFI